MNLEKRVALVTGAASEIGYVYVKYLLQKRVKVKKKTFKKITYYFDYIVFVYNIHRYCSKSFIV